jgi:hypothetical protein
MILPRISDWVMYWVLRVYMRALETIGYAAELVTKSTPKEHR